MMSQERIIEYYADWLVDAVAMATQNRALLRGDSAEDKILTEALYLNGKKAIELAFKQKELK
jgi:hypothetical protein